MALPKYINEYKPFNYQEKKDFYDLMTPHWSNAMAKQYNKDMTEFEARYNFPNMNKSNEEVMRISPNGVSFKGSKDAINPSHYQGI